MGIRRGGADGVGCRHEGVYGDGRYDAGWGGVCLGDMRGRGLICLCERSVCVCVKERGAGGETRRR